MINHDLVKRLPKINSGSATWNTKAGTFKTNSKVKCKFTLPEFYENRDIQWEMYVDNSPNDKCRYDMIIGRDLLEALGMDFLFSKGIMTWDNAEVPMKPHDSFNNENIDAYENEVLLMHDPDTTESERIQQTLDAKYSPADLAKEVEKCTELALDQREMLLTRLKTFEHLFDGTLGTWKTDPIKIELKPEAKPYCARPYPVPWSQEKKLKDEVKRLEQWGILRKKNDSEWGAPMFTISKPDGTLRSLADFRELNKRIKRKPFPIPKIQDMLQKLRGFMWVTAFDLNMGYYHIVLDPTPRSYCTIILPWGKYEYMRLPMGLCNSPDIFQEKMSDLMSGLEFARAYIDDLLIIGQGTFEEHLDQIEQVMTRLSQAGLKINISKSKLARSEVEYLGYYITRHGIRPISSKVKAITNLATPQTRKELRQFIGLVNYYRDLWPRRSETLAPLAKLTSIKEKWKWTDECQEAFENMKKIVAKEVLLAYPDFSKAFEIHTDASKTQLGAVIAQDNKPIAFYSRKLNPAQTRYTTTERELLSIVETLKEFRNILLGQQIIVYTDHENLTYKTFNSDRVMRWRLFIEEYSPDLRYVKGEKNIVADALSRLNIKVSTLQEEDMTEEIMYQTYCYAKSKATKQEEKDERNPLNYKSLGEAQSKDKNLRSKITSKVKGYSIKKFKAAEKFSNLSATTIK